MYKHAKVEDLIKIGWTPTNPSSAKSEIELGEELLQSIDDSMPETVKDCISLLAGAITISSGTSGKTNVFRPLIDMHEKRSVVISDYTAEHLAVLNHLLPHISNPLAKARIADILWHREKNTDILKQAISYYVAAGDSCGLEGEWLKAAELLRRGWLLCVSTGKLTQSLQPELREKYSALFEAKDVDNNARSVLLKQFVDSQLFGCDSAEWVSKSAIWAEEEHKSGNFSVAVSFHKSAARICSLSGDKAGELKLLDLVATLLEEEASQLKLNGAKGMLLAGKYSEAITARRRLPDSKQKVEGLKLALQEAQREAVSEFKLASHSIDITEGVERLFESIETLPTHQAIAVLAKYAAPRTKQRLKDQALEIARANPLQHLIKATIVDEHGAVVHQSKGSIFSDDADERALAAEELTYKHFVHDVTITGAMIAKGISKLRSRFDTHEYIFDELLIHNVIVPEGHQRQFAKGLWAGFNEDWITCCHILIPRLEAAVRTALRDAGDVNTTKLSPQLIQDQETLTSLLDGKTAAHFFGDDLLFELRALLTERAAFNFRNLVAHGLARDSQFDEGLGAFIWAFSLYLLMIAKSGMLGSPGDAGDNGQRGN